MTDLSIHEDLDKLELALTHMQDLVSKERIARKNWLLEDKDEWRRRRISAMRVLLAALAEYP